MVDDITDRLLPGGDFDVLTDAHFVAVEVFVRSTDIGNL
jgi:hypothetical protein